MLEPTILAFLVPDKNTKTAPNMLISFMLLSFKMYFFYPHIFLISTLIIILFFELFWKVKKQYGNLVNYPKHNQKC